MKLVGRKFRLGEGWTNMDSLGRRLQRRFPVHNLHIILAVAQGVSNMTRFGMSYLPYAQPTSKRQPPPAAPLK